MKTLVDNIHHTNKKDHEESLNYLRGIFISKSNDLEVCLYTEYLNCIKILFQLFWKLCPLITDDNTLLKQSRKESCLLLSFSVIDLFISTAITLIESESRIENPDISMSSNNPVNSLTEMYIVIHEHLGLHNICCKDGGNFVQQILEHTQSKFISEYTNEVFQSFHCLYGIKIKVLYQF